MKMKGPFYKLNNISTVCDAIIENLFEKIDSDLLTKTYPNNKIYTFIIICNKQ